MMSARYNWDRLRALQRLMEASRTSASLEACFALVDGQAPIRSCQKRPEILGLLDMLRAKPPAYACEIGTAMGGTLFMLSRACRHDALLVTVDLDNTLTRTLIYGRLRRSGQRVRCIRGNSRARETIARVTHALSGHALDFLLIDGDHSYAGVSADFANYAPLVKPGGIIALHDIVQDYRTRFGTPTGADTGDVPVFWRELKSRYRTREFVQDPDQDGYGIGVVFV